MRILKCYNKDFNFNSVNEKIISWSLKLVIDTNPRKLSSNFAVKFTNMLKINAKLTFHLKVITISRYLIGRQNKHKNSPVTADFSLTNTPRR